MGLIGFKRVLRRNLAFINLMIPMGLKGQNQDVLLCGSQSINFLKI